MALTAAGSIVMLAQDGASSDRQASVRDGLLFARDALERCICATARRWSTGTTGDDRWRFIDRTSTAGDCGRNHSGIGLRRPAAYANCTRCAGCAASTGRRVSTTRRFAALPTQRDAFAVCSAARRLHARWLLYEVRGSLRRIGLLWKRPFSERVGIWIRRRLALCAWRDTDTRARDSRSTRSHWDACPISRFATRPRRICNDH